VSGARRTGGLQRAGTCGYSARMPGSATVFDPASDLAALRALCDTIDRLLERAGAELLTVVPSVSGWSAEHHLAHVALANELVLRNLKSLAVGKGALVVRGGEAHPRALELLAEGRLPRGEAQAPRMVRPPEAVERELLLGWLADARRELATLDPRTLVPTEHRVPHQLIGPLDAPQWARFAAVHTRHHLVIVREILQHAAPDAAPLELAPIAPCGR
jgi:hypothetical protein